MATEITPDSQTILTEIKKRIWVPFTFIFFVSTVTTKLLDTQTPNGGFGLALLSVGIILPLFIIYAI
jgi:hypothetical protein